MVAGIRSFLVLTALYFFTCSARTILPQNEHELPDVKAPLEKRLPASTWYHSNDHPAHALFRRQASTDGVDYAEIGSPTWSAPYPSYSPDPSNLPQAWVNALDAAVSAGKIPDIPQSTMGASGNPVYPGGLDPTGDEVCSATYQCRADGDIWDAPDGVAGACFDDGPLPTSRALYDFLQDQGVHATHFMIGVNILENPDEFQTAFQSNQDDIAVHTWTHPYMTTLSNLQILGEFGWTIQLIHNSTGGRLPRFWRPPYGDADTRVRAIAQEIFGLTTVLWNHDTSDWSLTTGGTTMTTVHDSLEKWYSGPQSPGLIILEHELSNLSVQAYINAFPLIAQNGWDLMSLAQMDGNGAYQNVDGDGGDIQYTDSVLAFDGDRSTDNTVTGTGADIATNMTASASSTTPGSATRTTSAVSASTTGTHTVTSSHAASTTHKSGAVSSFTFKAAPLSLVLSLAAAIYATLAYL